MRIGCIFCGRRVWPWQKIRQAPIGKARIVCHAKCYAKRFAAYSERHEI